MTDRLDLPDSWRRQIEALLAEHVPEAEVWAYGSRVTGRNHEASDLDLVLRGPNLEPVPTGQLSDLRDALDESDIPILVQFHDWPSLPPSFHPEIKRQYVRIRPAADEDVELDVGSFAPFSYGKSLPRNKRNLDGSVPVYGSNGIVGWHDTTLTSGPTVVIGRKGTAGVVHYSPVPCWPIDTTFFIEGDDADLVRYKYYLLRSLHLEERNADSAVPGLNRNDAHSIMIVTPDALVQRQIAQVLGTFDDRIELNRRMSETLEAMAQALFQSWFVDFDPVRAKVEGRPSGLPPDLDALFPAAFEQSELGEIPEGWGTRELKEVIDVNPIRIVRRGHVAPHVEMAAVPTRGPQVKAWTYREYTSGSRFTGGDTLFGRITPSLENGKVALVDFLDHDAVGWGSTEFIVLRPRPPWPPEYAYIMAREARFRNHAIVNMTGTSGRQRVPADAISAYRMPIPDDDVVVTFGRLVQPWFESTTNLGRQSDCLAEQRDALLPRLLSGRLRMGGTQRPVRATA